MKLEIIWLRKWLKVDAKEEEVFYLGHCINCLLRSDVKKKKMEKVWRE